MCVVKTNQMKKSILLLSLFLISFNQITAQESSIKNFPLNEYIAPEIKYRALDLNAFFSSEGDYHQGSKAYTNNLTLNADVLYYSYSNTNKHQGINSSNLLANTSFDFGKAYEDKSNLLSSTFYIDYYSQNRIYWKGNKFVGIHVGSNYNWNNTVGNSNDPNLVYNDNEITVTPYFSLGIGRIQPIYSARKAQDILVSLNKYGRLKRSPTMAEIDTLARVANRIEYKRFYDSRFKRIYQLVELDEALQGMGLIDSADIVYFANLGDIWSFAGNRNRGSGSRFEGGVIPQITMYDRDNNSEMILGSQRLNEQNFGAFGFLSFNSFKALSFCWQSDFLIDFSLGYYWNEKTIEYGNDTGSFTDNVESWNGLLNISWQLGYIPNTRTSFTLTPYTSFSYGISHTGSENEKAGINTGLRFSGNYYISPRFRVHAYAYFMYYNDFSNAAPSPFWNTISYHSDNRYATTNDVVQKQYSYSFRNLTQRNGYDYGFRFAISYALF